MERPDHNKKPLSCNSLTSHITYLKLCYGCKTNFSLVTCAHPPMSSGINCYVLTWTLAVSIQCTWESECNDLKEVMFSPVCLFVSTMTQKLQNRFPMKLGRMMGHGPKTNHVNFGCRYETGVDPGIFVSLSLILQNMVFTVFPVNNSLPLIYKKKSGIFRSLVSKTVWNCSAAWLNLSLNAMYCWALVETRALLSPIQVFGLFMEDLIQVVTIVKTDDDRKRWK